MNRTSIVVVTAIVATLLATLVGCHHESRLKRSAEEVVAVGSTAEEGFCDKSGFWVGGEQAGATCQPESSEECQQGCFCDNGHWVGKDGQRTEGVYCQMKDSDKVKSLEKRLHEVENEIPELEQEVADWRYEAMYVTDINKELIQTNRTVFVEGEKVTLRRGCKPEVSITDTASNTTTYVVKCAQQ